MTDANSFDTFYEEIFIVILYLQRDYILPYYRAREVMGFTSHFMVYGIKSKISIKISSFPVGLM